ncbi:hypothetical protein [Castellaniella sp.]|uniref:hypothetical protein n=1 Tax=Castellaniella sp. TaxID=1955812 RepID=UPI003A8CDCA8
MTSAANVAELKRLLALSDERASLAARLRPLMPFVQSCVQAGLPYAALLDDLATAGLTIKPRLLERSLYRWRKAQQPQSDHAPVQPPLLETCRPGLGGRVSAPDSAIQGRPRRIETPADLRQIRDMRIDLDALRREGEALRKAEKAKQQTPSSPQKPSPQESST